MIILMRHLLLLCAISLVGAAAVVAVAVGYSPTFEFSDVERFAASVFFADSVTAEELKAKYAKAAGGQGKVKILIVPGHDNESWGTEFNGVREAEMTVAVGEELFRLFSLSPVYEPMLVRDRTGYTPVFKEYFASETANVRTFVLGKRRVMSGLEKSGKVYRTDGISPNAALSSVVFRLYAINKWANDNGIDIVLHIHFNDYPGRANHRTGRYEGFAFYVPDSQYSNAKASRAVAQSLLEQFATFYAESNLPVENGGIVPDQELIAIGAYNTLDGASVLLEYGYIYETRFRDERIRAAFMKELALQTYIGVNRFFGKFEEAFRRYPTTLLPHEWRTPLSEGAERNPSVLSLQAALLFEGVYPPEGDKRGCPLTGSFGPCTRRAVAAFQQKNGIAPASGVAGPQTLAKLNEKYSR